MPASRWAVWSAPRRAPTESSTWRRPPPPRAPPCSSTEACRTSASESNLKRTWPRLADLYPLRPESRAAASPNLKRAWPSLESVAGFEPCDDLAAAEEAGVEERGEGLAALVGFGAGADELELELLVVLAGSFERGAQLDRVGAGGVDQPAAGLELGAQAVGGRERFLELLELPVVVLGHQYRVAAGLPARGQGGAQLLPGDVRQFGAVVRLAHEGGVRGPRAASFTRPRA